MPLRSRQPPVGIETPGEAAMLLGSAGLYTSEPFSGRAEQHPRHGTGYREMPHVPEQVEKAPLSSFFGEEASQPEGQK